MQVATSRAASTAQTRCATRVCPYDSASWTVKSPHAHGEEPQVEQHPTLHHRDGAAAGQAGETLREAVERHAEKVGQALSPPHVLTLEQVREGLARLGAAELDVA